MSEMTVAIVVAFLVAAIYGINIGTTVPQQVLDNAFKVCSSNNGLKSMYVEGPSTSWEKFKAVCDNGAEFKLEGK